MNLWIEFGVPLLFCVIVAAIILWAELKDPSMTRVDIICALARSRVEQERRERQQLAKEIVDEIERRKRIDMTVNSGTIHHPN